MKKRDWTVFAFFVILVIVIRSESFFESVIDPDESLYLLMAQSWLDGHLPYTEIWDNKPPGIYILFSIALILFGKSVISIRVLACIAIIITCNLLYKLGNIIGKNGAIIGLIAGTLYAINSLSNEGLASNTEIFFTPFVTLAVYLFIHFVYKERYLGKLTTRTSPRILMIGLLMGIGFEIKYVVIFDFIAILLTVGISFYFGLLKSSKYFSILKYYALLSIGFILPFLLISLYFIFNKQFDSYLYSNFVANKARTIDNSFSFTTLAEAIKNQVNSNPTLWLWLLITPFYISITRKIDSEERKKIAFFLTWFFVDLLGICFVFRGDFYLHYFLQLTPSQCLISCYLFIRLINIKRKEAKDVASVEQYFLLALILIAPLLHYAGIVGFYLRSSAENLYFRQVKGLEDWGDGPAAIGKYIKARINRNDYIYVVDYQPIIYFLTQAKIPTKYAFPSFLVGGKESLSRITGNDPIQELNSIMQKRPVYIIKKNNDQDLFYTELNKYLEKYYTLEVLRQDVKLYRLKN